MSVKVEFGFWWTRDGKLAFVGCRGADGKFAGWIVGHGQHVWRENGIIVGSSTQDLVEYIGMTHPGVNERPKPEPKWVPWTADDNICGTIVKAKAKPMTYVICTQGPFLVQVGGMNMSYGDLFSDCIQLDGKPCGKQVTE